MCESKYKYLVHSKIRLSFLIHIHQCYCVFLNLTQAYYCKIYTCTELIPEIPQEKIYTFAELLLENTFLLMTYQSSTLIHSTWSLNHLTSLYILYNWSSIQHMARVKKDNFIMAAVLTKLCTPRQSCEFYFYQFKTLKSVDGTWLNFRSLPKPH